MSCCLSFNELSHSHPWEKESSRFEEELDRWKYFRGCQLSRRKNQDEIARAQQHVQNWYQKHGIRDDLVPQLQLSLELQTKTDSWKEHYYDQRWSCRKCEESVEWTRRKVEGEKERERKRIEEEGPYVTEERQAFWNQATMAERAFWYQETTAESDLRYCEDRLSRMNEYLKWIERQLPIIASEWAALNSVSKAVNLMNHNANVVVE